MIHPDTELRYINDIIGCGVFATRLIPLGTIVWCLDQLDQVISPERARHLPDGYQSILDKYAFRDREGNFVLCWDNSRFVNHSFRPNCLPTPYDVELAVRDIQPGEELTDHYGTLNLEQPFRALPEPGSRRRTAYPNDLVRHHRRWDRQLAQAFGKLRKVEQPLWLFVAAEQRRIIAQVADGERTMDSCLETWCPEPADRAAVGPADALIGQVEAH